MGFVAGFNICVSTFFHCIYDKKGLGSLRKTLFTHQVFYVIFLVSLEYLQDRINQYGWIRQLSVTTKNEILNFGMLASINKPCFG